MKSCLISAYCLSLLFLAAAAASPPAPVVAAPAPAPAPDYVNLTDLLSVAGPFHTFLNYLESTKVLETFQNQANNTDQGITIFVPKDQAFSSMTNKAPSLSNLTGEQLKSLILFHGLPQYYSLSDFNNLSRLNPVPTFAGSNYNLNFTDNSGTVNIDSGWTTTKVSSAVHAAFPVAIYQVDKVLLPEAIFGTNIPPTPAPVPAPAAANTDPADQRRAGGRGIDADSSNSPNGAPSSSASAPTTSRISNLGVLIMSAIVLVLTTSIDQSV